MSKPTIYAIASSLITISLVHVCSAQQAVPYTPLTPAPAAQLSANPALYNGGAIGDNGVGLAPWGGGTVSQDDTTKFEDAAHSLKVESPGLYQGGEITFAQPVNLGDTSDKSKYLEFQLKLATDPKYVKPPAPTPTLQQNGPGGPGGPNRDNSAFQDSTTGLFKLVQGRDDEQGQPQSGGRGRLGPNGEPIGQNGPGGPGGYPGGPPNAYQPNQGANGYVPNVEPAPPALPAKSIHLIFTMSDGSQVDTSRDLPALDLDQDWVLVSVPISKLRVAGAPSATVSAVTICSDNPTFINIGQIKLVTDTTPITCSTGGSKDVSPGISIVFNGTASGGASMLKYQWDFDTNGPFVEQAAGPYATHTYATTGAYNVTLIVTDVDGIKAPATATTVVHVE